MNSGRRLFHVFISLSKLIHFMCSIVTIVFRRGLWYYWSLKCSCGIYIVGIKDVIPHSIKFAERVSADSLPSPAPDPFQPVEDDRRHPWVLGRLLSTDDGGHVVLGVLRLVGSVFLVVWGRPRCQDRSGRPGGLGRQRRREGRKRLGWREGRKRLR